MKKIFVLMALSAFMQGCMTKAVDLKQDVVFQQSIPVCQSEDVCKKMWQAAGDWVHKYSPQGIDIYTDNLIVSEDREVGSDNMNLEVRKVKQADGSFKIIIDNFCTRNCDAERRNMLAFNKELMNFMTVKEQAQREAVFDENNDLKEWVVKYERVMNSFDANSVSGLYSFPVTYINQESITVLSQVADVVAYLKNSKVQMQKHNAQYLRLNGLNVYAKTGRSSYIGVTLRLYDADNSTVSEQRVTLHLVRVDNHWKMISAGFTE
ncbi:MAG: hypothetical protein OEY29_01205 [Gammaproteobacteria bacterium]|nr:hypothetical protein [Gammaproteobacteria bacterium]